MAEPLSKVFDETYLGYMEEINRIDFLARAPAMNVQRDGDSLLIPLYDKLYRFSKEGIDSPSGAPLSPAVRVMICKYILTCPSPLPELSNTLCTYREFKNSAPLVSYFTTNTNKALESRFSGDLPSLRSRAMAMGAQLLESESYDISLLFYALPRIPVMLNFNDRDELFPATCSILYRRSAALFLDMECLSMTGTLLAKRLLA
jgi:hypothetical protein